MAAFRHCAGGQPRTRSATRKAAADGRCRTRCQRPGKRRRTARPRDPIPRDPAAGLLLTLSGADADADAADEQLAEAGRRSIEANLFRCRIRLARGDLRGARENLAGAAGLGGRGDWRIRWHDALTKLADGRPADAKPEFDAVYRALPGEVVPKLALGLCTEYLGDLRAAERLYEMVWQADQSYVSAAFGLARTRIRSVTAWARSPRPMRSPTRRGTLARHGSPLSAC